MMTRMKIRSLASVLFVSDLLERQHRPVSAPFDARRARIESLMWSNG
jgi:hypothetical protein